MFRLNRFIRFISLALIIALIATVLSSFRVAAATGITVSGAILVTEVTPGEILTHKITVTLGMNESPVDLIIQTGGIGQAINGTYILLDESNDNSLFSAREYISLDKYSLHLTPGISQDVIATVRVPDDIKAGGRYALINMQTLPTGSGNIGIVSAVNIPVYLTVKNTELIYSGDITSIAAGEINSGSPIDISTTFRNTGNHHFKISSEVTIRGPDGELLETIFSSPTPTSLIPAMSREIRVTFIPAKELLTGKYSVHVKIIAEDGTLLDEGDTYFEVLIPLSPPSPPTKQTVIPTESAVLQTPDEIISIVFPKGAVTEAVDIILRDYPLLQLPPLPPEYAPTGICFRVDGISGLLLQEATITVKFTDEELSKAGTDTGRLKLAYWNEGTSEWTLIKTKADKDEMTLTATTNHFSIWTVMVEPVKSIDMTIIAGAVALFIFAAIGGLLVLIKKNKP